MGFHPWMIQGCVVWNEVEHEPDATLIQLSAEARERTIATQFPRCSITGDRVRGAGDLAAPKLFFTAGERLPAPGATAFAQCPNPHEPDMREPATLPEVELRIGNIPERQATAHALGKFSEPAAGVNFVEKRMHWRKLQHPRTKLQRNTKVPTSKSGAHV